MAANLLPAVAQNGTKWPNFAQLWPAQCPISYLATALRQSIRETSNPLCQIQKSQEVGQNGTKWAGNKKIPTGERWTIAWRIPCRTACSSVVPATSTAARRGQPVGTCLSFGIYLERSVQFSSYIWQE